MCDLVAYKQEHKIKIIFIFGFYKNIQSKEKENDAQMDQIGWIHGRRFFRKFDRRHGSRTSVWGGSF